MVRRSFDRCRLRRGRKYDLGDGVGGGGRGSRSCSGSDSGGDRGGGEVVSGGGGVRDMFDVRLLLTLVLVMVVVMALLVLFRHVVGALVLAFVHVLFREQQRLSPRRAPSTGPWTIMRRC